MLSASAQPSIATLGTSIRENGSYPLPVRIRKDFMQGRDGLIPSELVAADYLFSVAHQISEGRLIHYPKVQTVAKKLDFSGAWESIRNQTANNEYAANNSVKRKNGVELWESTLISGPNWMQVNNYSQQRNALITALYSESSEVTGIDLEGTDRILLFRETFIRLTDLTPGRRNTFLSGTFKYDGPYCFIALESDGFSNPDGSTILFPGGGVQMSYDWITGEPLGLL